MNKIISPSIASSLLLGSVAAFSIGVESSSAADLSIVTIDSSQITMEKNPNDCSGVFGQGFSNCDIGNVFSDENTTIEISPVVAKFDLEDDGNLKLSLNQKYDASIQGGDGTIDGSEFTVDLDPGNKTGSFGYTPGTGDPGIRYWVTKSANAFKLNFKVDEQLINDGTCSEANEFSLDCINSAEVITSFDWSTMNNKELSHLTVYNTEDANDDVPNDAPEPITLLASFATLGFAFKLNNQYSEEE